MFKRLLIVAITAAGAVALQKKLRDQKAEQELWAEATDDVRSKLAT
ncbi:MAG: DLW-39 family protein [Lapillicoccus sp.]